MFSENESIQTENESADSNPIMEEDLTTEKAILDKEVSPEEEEFFPDEEAISEEIDALILQMQESEKNEKGIFIPADRNDYASEHVISSSKVVVTEKSIKKDERNELAASYRTGRKLEGIITGFHPSNPEDELSTLVVEVDFRTGTIPVYIPSYALFDYNYSDIRKPTAEEQRIIQNELIRRIGSPVKFIVVAMTKDGAIGDRLAAMSSEAGVSTKTKLSRQAAIRKDALVNATIVSVRHDQVILEFGGCEIKVPHNELDYCYIPDATTEVDYAGNLVFEVGKNMVVRIKTIQPYKCTKNNRNYTLYNVTGSIKDTKKDETKKIYDSLRVGGVYPARVLNVMENGTIVRVKGKYDAMIPPLRDKDSILYRGQKINVRITKKQDEDRRVFAQRIR